MAAAMAFPDYTRSHFTKFDRSVRLGQTLVKMCSLANSS